MLPLSVPALILALGHALPQTPEEKLANLDPAAQAAAAGIKQLGYKLVQATAGPKTRGVVELKRPDAPETVVVVLSADRVKLHLNVPISEVLYGRSETLKKQLVASFPGLEQIYLGSSDGKNLANLSLVSKVAAPPKAWYGETLATLQRAADQLLDKPHPGLAKLPANPFQKSVVELVKRAGWRIDDAGGFRRDKEPPGVYLAVSRSEAPAPHAALPPLTIKIHHNAVDLDAIGFVPARDEAGRGRFQNQLQKTFPAYKVTVLSSSLTPGYDRVVLSLPEPIPAAAVPGKLPGILQRTREALATIK